MNNLQYLYDIMEEKGYIPEEVWEEVGIPKDVTSDGEVFERKDTVNKENETRGRILTHLYVKNQRQERRDEIDEAIRQKKLREDKKITDSLATDAATLQDSLSY